LVVSLSVRLLGRVAHVKDEVSDHCDGRQVVELPVRVADVLGDVRRPEDAGELRVHVIWRMIS